MFVAIVESFNGGGVGCVGVVAVARIEAECAVFTGKRGVVVKCGAFINAVIKLRSIKISGVEIAAEMFGC